MASLEEIVQAMMGAPAQEMIAESNPYYQFAPIGKAFAEGAAGAQTSGDDPRRDMWNKAIAASIGSALSGGLQGLGEGRQQELTKGYTDMLFGRSDGASLPKGLFQKVEQAKLLKDKLEQMEIEKERRKLAGALIKTAALEDLKVQNAGKLAAAKIEGEDAAYKNLRSKRSGEVEGGGLSTEPKGEESVKSIVPLIEKYQDAGLSRKKAEEVAAAALKKEELKGLDAKSWWEQVPSQDKTKITLAVGSAANLENLAKEFEEMGKTSNIAKWKVGRQLSGTKEYQLASKMEQLIVPAIKLMGDVGNIAISEREAMIKSTLGNITAHPRDIAVRIRNLAQMAKDIVAGSILAHRTAITQGGDALLEQLSTPEVAPLSTDGEVRQHPNGGTYRKVEGGWQRIK